MRGPASLEFPLLKDSLRHLVHRAIDALRAAGELPADATAAFVIERTRNREIISERARRAARFVGAAPEWLDQTLTDEKKKCPRCAELIKAEASFCRFCQFDLTGKPPVPASR